MPKHTDRVRIEEVDWQAVFPWVKLLGSFKMAMHPGKLLTSLLLVVLLFVAGKALDAVLPGEVYPGDLDQYRQVHFGITTPEQYKAWRDTQEAATHAQLLDILSATKGFKGDLGAIANSAHLQRDVRAALHEHYTKTYAQNQLDREQTKFDKDWNSELKAIRSARQKALAQVDALKTRGAFEVALKQAIHAGDRLVRAVVTCNFFSNDVAYGGGPAANLREIGNEGIVAELVNLTPAPSYYHDQTTALAALSDLFVILPCWLWHQHTLHLLAFVLVALLLTAFLGGSVARMAAVHATRDDRISLREAMRFVLPRWWSFLLTPLVPLLLVAGVALLMGVGGLVLFNPPAWGIDILGGLLFGVAILCGFIVMVTLLLSAAGIHLVYPATAVNGSDLFDAIARAFNYVLNRPWRWLFYNAIVLIQGCVMYLLLTLMLGIAVWAVQHFTGMWVFTTTDLGVNRFETILPPPGAVGLSYEIDYASLDWSGRISALLVRGWMFLTIGLLAAFVVSYYFCANTWAYLLLRRDADGIELEDVLIDPPVDPNAPKPPANVEEASADNPAQTEE